MIANSGVVRTIAAALRHGRATQAELRTYQDAQFRRLVAHAYERVAYYRKLFDRHRLHPRHIRGLVDLELIPISTKQDLRATPVNQLVDRELDPAQLIAVRTSGSSGEPFTIRRTWMEQSLQYLFRLRAFHHFGIGLRDRDASLGLVRDDDPKDQKLIGRAIRAVGLQPALEVDGLQDPRDIIRELAAFQPDVLSGMPGMLCRVADQVLAEQRYQIQPRLMVVGGEVLTPLMQQRLLDAFGVVPLQTYGSHEFPLIGWECRDTGEMHTCDDGVVVEVLRDGQPVEPGDRGEVVATNLHAYSMPFIRYRLGDIVTRGRAACACGRPFATITAVQGRMIDYFPLPDGRTLHPYQILGSFIRGADGWIRHYQLLQERLDRIVLRVVPAEAPSVDQLARIQRSVLPLLGPGVEFQVSLVEDIPLEESGKFRPSRSLVASEHDLRSHPAAHA